MGKRSIGKTIKKTAQLVGMAQVIKPSLFIIGTQKGGTTYLFNFLNQQEKISSSARKEFDFFSTNHFYNKGLQWYLDYFIFRRKHQITFEASANYLYYSKSYQRIFDYNPKSKLIILLRNPTERAYSSWNMYKRMWLNNKENIIHNYFNILDTPQKEEGLLFINQKEYPSFSESIKNEIDIFHQSGMVIHEPGFLFRGIYYYQVKQILSLFNRKQILFIENKDLKNMDFLCQTLEEFLQTPIHPTDIERSLRFEGNYQEAIDEEIELILDDFYNPFNKKLSQLLQQEFHW